MTINQHVPLPTEKCIFPFRNDGETPEKRWKVVELPTSCLEEGMRACQATEANHAFVLATVWALVLWQFADTETACMGLTEVLAAGEESFGGIALKRQMKMLAASRNRNRPVKDLFQADEWNMSSINQASHSHFNTGIVLCQQHSRGKLSSTPAATGFDGSREEAWNLSF
jgi:hypothetical protein